MSLRMLYSPILLRSIAQVQLLNHLPSQDLESGDTTKKLEKKDPLSASFKMLGEQHRNRKAIKALIRCTHFLAHQHIAQTTNFDKLVELVVSFVVERLFKPSLTVLEGMQRTPKKWL